MTARDRATIVAVRNQLLALAELVNSLLLDATPAVPAAPVTACPECGGADWTPIGGFGPHPPREMCKRCGHESAA